MKTKHLTLIATVVQFIPTLAHAQTEQSTKSSPGFTDFLWAFVPLLILLVVFMPVLFWIIRCAQSGPRGRRADQHMERVEQQLERIAKALEKEDSDAA
jgi:hypothetical protein